jgi:phospholipid transport system transporter-binding protein
MTDHQSIQGALTFDTVPDWFARGSGWFSGDNELIIDLSGVTRADSAGLALLIEWLRLSRSAKRPLRFTNIPDQVLTLTRINGLQDALFPSHA